MTIIAKPASAAALLLAILSVASGSWLPEERLSDSAGVADSTSPVNAKCIGCDRQGNISVVWYSRTGASYSIRYRRWDAQLGLWDTVVTISPLGTNARRPALAVDDSGNVHVVWQADSTICYRCRLAASGQWGAVETIAMRTNAACPSIAARQPGFLVAAWCAIRTSNCWGCYFSRRAENRWSTPELVSPSAAEENHIWPAIGLANDSSATVCWITTTAGGKAFARTWSPHSGWGNTFTLLGDYVRNSAPSVAAEPNGTVHTICWAELASSDTRLVYRQRRNGSWHDSILLPRPATIQDPGSIAVDELSRPHVIWCAPIGSYRQVHHSCGDTLGQSWLPIDTLTAARADRHNPSISCGPDGSVQVVWYDMRNSSVSPDIYCRRFYRRLRDVGVTRLSASMPVDSSLQCSLIVWLRNNGDSTESDVPIWFTTPDTTVVRIVPTVAARESVRVAWDSCLLHYRGLVTVACSTGITGEWNRSNNTLQESLFVRVLDAAADSLVGLADTILTDTLRPGVWLTNRGNASATVLVLMWIEPSGYAESTSVVLPAGTARLVMLPSWRVEPGEFVLHCSLRCDCDLHPENDTIHRRFCVVRNVDAAALAILRPLETVSRGQVVPAANVANQGNAPAAVPVRFTIASSSNPADTAYQDSLIVWLGPNEDRNVEFAPWEITHSGYYTAVCWTELVNDRQPANDTTSADFRVAAIDAALTAIEHPADTIQPGSTVPVLRIANLGDETAEPIVLLSIVPDTGQPVYADSATVAVAAGQSRTLTPRPWTAQPGWFRLRASVRLAGDENRANDTLQTTVLVESFPSRRWLGLQPVPDQRGVRAGGSLCPVSAGLFAITAGNRPHCFRYFATTDSWHRCADVPPGQSGRNPRHGAALCSDGSNHVFLVKGNRTRELWQYNVIADSWSGLVPIPAFTREFRFGSDLVYLAGDTNKLFAIKASGTREFLVYWLGQNQWHSRRPLPLGPDSLPARNGTALTSLAGRIFCLKGGTNEFYEYFPVGDSWRQRANLPLTSTSGRHRETRKGAALTSDGSRYCYAFKGGGSNEFWRYDRQADQWQQLPDLPEPRHRYRVREGGALAYYLGRCYAFKGGGATEFWMFDPTAGDCPPSPLLLAVSAVRRSGASPSLGQLSEPAYDITGRKVKAGLTQPGIYFVRTNNGTRKLLLLRRP